MLNQTNNPTGQNMGDQSAPQPPRASTADLQNTSYANDNEGINLEDVRQEYSEEQARLQRSMRRVRYWTGVLVMMTAIFLGYVMWYRPEARAIENKKTEKTSLDAEVKQLKSELNRATAVATYFEPINAYREKIAAATGTAANTIDKPLNLRCLDLIDNALEEEKSASTTGSRADDITTSGTGTASSDSDKESDNPSGRGCKEVIAAGSNLTFPALRAAYLLQESDKTQTYFDLQRTLAYIDTILLEYKEEYDFASTKDDYYDRVKQISFGDVTAAQDQPLLDVVPITIELQFADEKEAIDFARKIESRLVNDVSLQHLYMIDDMTFDIAKHTEPQEVTIELSLYLYNPTAVSS